MSARGKGNRSEVKAVKELEAEGYIVYRVKGATKFIRNVDMFGIFDLVAKRGKETRWVQVKTNNKPKLDVFKDFKKMFCSKYESVEVWVYKDYKGCDKIVI